MSSLQLCHCPWPVFSQSPFIGFYPGPLSWTVLNRWKCNTRTELVGPVSKGASKMTWNPSEGWVCNLVIRTTCDFLPSGRKDAWVGQGRGELADFRLSLADVWPGLRKSESKLKDPKMEENTIAFSRKQPCPPHRVGYVFMPHREDHGGFCASELPTE